MTGTQTDAEKAAAEKAAKDAAAAEKAAKKAAEPPKRYGAYNVSLGKYVGGVRDTKAEADKIAKGIKDAGYTAEVREV
jgi:hypothetical protein